MILGTIGLDTHPPGYYVTMWFVTKIFGTSTWAMRMPSILFGVGSIALLYWLGTLIGQRAPAAIAAILLAANGYHMFWSQAARMYSMVCFLALLSACLALILSRGAHSRLLEIAYAAVLLAGVCSHVYFWAVVGSQMLWIALDAWAANRTFPRLLAIQMMTAILGSSMLAIAVYQSGNPVAVLSGNLALTLGELLQFGLLLPANGGDTYPADWTPAMDVIQPLSAARWGLILLTVTLLVLGIRRLKRSGPELAKQSPLPSRGAWIASIALATGSILCVVAVAQFVFRPKPSLGVTRLTLAIPFVLAAGAGLLYRMWTAIQPRIPSTIRLAFAECQLLPALMALMPPFLLAVVSLLFRPIMDNRGLLFIIPFLLLLIACGLTAILERNRFVGVSLLLGLAVLHTFSVRMYAGRTVDPMDHRRFAEAVRPQIQQTDLVFFRRGWDTTPILYYLDNRRYHLVVKDYAEASHQDPASRVWVLLFYEEPLPQEIQAALSDYQMTQTVQVNQGRALLYQRNRGVSANAR